MSIIHWRRRIDRAHRWRRGMMRHATQETSWCGPMRKIMMRCACHPKKRNRPPNGLHQRCCGKALLPLPLSLSLAWRHSCVKQNHMNVQYSVRTSHRQSQEPAGSGTIKARSSHSTNARIHDTTRARFYGTCTNASFADQQRCANLDKSVPWQQRCCTRRC